MAGTLWASVRQTVLETCERYKLLSRAGPVAVAFSGGKDSLLLSLMLAELGVPIICISVDMGYEKDWAARITSMARRAGLPLDVVNVRIRRSSMDVAPAQEMKNSLRTLQLLKSDATPCTHCYHVKVLALEDAARLHGASTVAFGHHRTDALASLLKEALLHVDRWDDGHRRFDRENFAAKVEHLSDEVDRFERGHKSKLLDRITDLVQSDKVDTDEPPRQYLNRDNPGVDIIRPLFFVDERSLISLVADMDIQPEGSGCGHGLASKWLTPREMVHYRVLRRPHSTQLNDHFQHLLMWGIDSEGRARLEARRHRAKLLGKDYKPGPNKP